ncbi:MAG: cbb3-type cytochrome c oxidase subunit 3 [Pseudomonadota bacterium]
MELYTALRAFADSWGLLGLTLVFLGVVAFTLRPGSRSVHRQIADIPMRHEEAPAPEEPR